MFSVRKETLSAEKIYAGTNARSQLRSPQGSPPLGQILADADVGPAAGASEEAQACVHKLQTQVIEIPLFLLMVSSAAAAASLLLQMDDPFRLEAPLLLVMMY